MRDNANTFETGKSYFFSFVGDSELRGIVEVVSRTAKTLTYTYGGKQARSKIYAGTYGEYVKPTGVYSMAPSCYARDVEQTTQELKADLAAASKALFETVKRFNRQQGRTEQSRAIMKALAGIDVEIGRIA